MKQHNKIIIYDDTCPMCTWYTGAFVKTGLLHKDGRQAFSQADANLLAAIDTNRGKNEIPLVDTTTRQVWYGIDAMLEVMGQKFALIKTLGHLKPVKWFLLRLYRFITYNRRVIVAPRPVPGGFDCAPDFNLKYRSFFMLFFLVLNTLLIPTLHQHIYSNSIFAGVTLQRFLGGHGGLVLFNILLALLLPLRRRMEYLGQVTMLATLFFLGGLPLLAVNQLLADGNAIVNTIYIGILGGLIGREYIRRMLYARILPQYRRIVIADVLSILAFFVYLLY